MKTTNHRLIFVVLLSFLLCLPFLVSAAGAYEKEMLTTDFKATGRAFYALARVNAENATGTYLREFNNDESRTKAFINNGCLLKCLYPPEDGWITVELFNTGGEVHEKDLSFDIGAIKPVMNCYRAVRNVVLSYDPRDADPNWHEILQPGQQCTVLYLSWPNTDTCQHYYMIEADDMYGYVPMDSIEKWVTNRMSLSIQCAFDER